MSATNTTPQTYHDTASFFQILRHEMFADLQESEIQGMMAFCHFADSELSVNKANKAPLEPKDCFSGLGRAPSGHGFNVVSATRQVSHNTSLGGHKHGRGVCDTSEQMLR